MTEKFKTICRLLLVVCFLGLYLPACGESATSTSSGSGGGTGSSGVSGSGK